MKKILIIFVLIFSGIVSLLFCIKQPIFFIAEKRSINSQASNSETLEKHVKTLSSHERFSPEGLELASIYILSTLKESGIDNKNIEIQKYSVGTRDYHNIIVSFSHQVKGPDVKKYVVGAHYDGHGLLPGADDNASGVAGMLEIARILNTASIGQRNIELVFYSTEEMPNFSTKGMGSYVHAEKNQDTELAIILEMIGYFSDEPGSQSFPVGALKYLYSDTGDYIALVSDFDNFSSVRNIKGLFASYLGKDSTLGLQSMNAPSSLVPEITRSDHSSYWKFGIPSLMITDTAFLRNKNYHTLEDTYEKLDYKRMKEVVDAVIYTVLNIE